MRGHSAQYNVQSQCSSPVRRETQLESYKQAKDRENPGSPNPQQSTWPDLSFSLSWAQHTCQQFTCNYSEIFTTLQPVGSGRDLAPASGSAHLAETPILNSISPWVLGPGEVASEAGRGRASRLT